MITIGTRSWDERLWDDRDWLNARLDTLSFFWRKTVFVWHARGNTFMLFEQQPDKSRDALVTGTLTQIRLLVEWEIAKAEREAKLRKQAAA